LDQLLEPNRCKATLRFCDVLGEKRTLWLVVQLSRKRTGERPLSALELRLTLFHEGAPPFNVIIAVKAIGDRLPTSIHVDVLEPESALS
jgi:hypothetical protein